MMKKIVILIGLFLLVSCGSSNKPEINTESVKDNNEINDYLSAEKFEVDGITYYWVHETNSYKFHETHVICPARDKAIINSQ